jgi:hypothetical protein
MYELKERLFPNLEWGQVQKLLERRQRLIHPTKLADLQLSDEKGDELFVGVVWLLSQLFNFMNQLHAREVAKVEANVAVTPSLPSA